jgi:hypothetical protein
MSSRFRVQRLELRMWGAGFHRSVAPRVANHGEIVCAPRNGELLDRQFSFRRWYIG